MSPAVPPRSTSIADFPRIASIRRPPEMGTSVRAALPFPVLCDLLSATSAPVTRSSTTAYTAWLRVFAGLCPLACFPRDRSQSLRSMTMVSIPTPPDGTCEVVESERPLRTYALWLRTTGELPHCSTTPRFEERPVFPAPAHPDLGFSQPTASHSSAYRRERSRSCAELRETHQPDWIERLEFPLRYPPSTRFVLLQKRRDVSRSLDAQHFPESVEVRGRT